MSAQTSLFDEGWRRAFTPPRPIARTTDPTESKVAAQSIAPANQLLVVAIRQTIRAAGHALTQFEISRSVVEEYEGRWNEASVRTACARAGLVKVGTKQVGKRHYGLYTLGEEAARVAS